MLNVDVIFPASGSIIVLGDPTAMVAERVINWTFYCQRLGITDVGIQFKDPDANFFNVRGIWQNHFEISLQHRDSMWAKPHRQKPNTRRRKYAVIAWDAVGTKIEELDPTIIIDDP